MNQIHLRVQIQPHGISGVFVFFKTTAGVEHEDVEPLPLRPYLIECRADIGGVRDVSLEQQYPALQSCYFLGNFLGAGCLVSIVEGNIRSCLGKLRGNTRSNASRRSGNKSRFP